jgi:hypothetical protein
VSIYGRHRTHLPVGDPGALNVTLVKAPQLSLVLLLTACSEPSAVGRTGRAARASVRESGRFALASLLASARRVFPDVAATPIPPTVDVSIDEHVQRLHDLPDDALVEDLANAFGPHLPPAWRPAAEQPRRWLDSYAAATLDAWPAVLARWQRAQPLLDAEARRVGAAVVRGSTDVLLNTLHPRIRYECGEIWVPAIREATVGLDGRRLVLVPTIAGSMGRLVAFDMPDLVYLAYPVPGQTGLGENGATPADSGGHPLGQVLGRARADVLQAADRPISMGQLAAVVGCSPRMTTYHAGQLEAAGLIVRERRGLSVWVSRTVRGHELVELLST